MLLAQKLYESGKITYMRTDSVSLSELATDAIKNQISSQYGAKYIQLRKFKNKNESAQEAHEAIRPTEMEQHDGGRCRLPPPVRPDLEADDGQPDGGCGAGKNDGKKFHQI
jgi:hypothetical protein